jgi:hypothetical protein
MRTLVETSASNVGNMFNPSPPRRALVSVMARAKLNGKRINKTATCLLSVKLSLNRIYRTP